MMKVDELETSQKSKRINVHTHIKGLGLDENGVAQNIGQGLVGQKDAREVYFSFNKSWLTLIRLQELLLI